MYVSLHSWLTLYIPQFLVRLHVSYITSQLSPFSILQVGRFDINYPKVAGHRGLVLDIAWNPFNENEIASSSEDCTVKLWDIPDSGLTENLTVCKIDLVAHSRKVGHLLHLHYKIRPYAICILSSNFGSFPDSFVTFHNLKWQEVMASSREKRAIALLCTILFTFLPRVRSFTTGSTVHGANIPLPAYLLSAMSSCLLVKHSFYSDHSLVSVCSIHVSCMCYDVTQEAHSIHRG